MAPGDQGRAEESRAAPSTLPVRAGYCNSDHSLARLSVPWLVRKGQQPRGGGLSSTNRRLQPKAPEPTRRVVCLTFCELLPPQGQTAPGRDVSHPSLPPLQDFLPGKTFCQQSCTENYNKSFPAPERDRQEDGGDLRADRALARRGHTAHVPAWLLPHHDASCCVPSAAFCKVAFPVASSVTPVLSPRDLFQS